VTSEFEILINYYIWSEKSSWRPLKAATCKGVKFSIAGHITWTCLKITLWKYIIFIYRHTWRNKDTVKTRLETGQRLYFYTESTVYWIT